MLFPSTENTIIKFLSDHNGFVPANNDELLNRIAMDKYAAENDLKQLIETLNEDFDAHNASYANIASIRANGQRLRP